jgi:hypothetical protein
MPALHLLQKITIVYGLNLHQCISESNGATELGSYNWCWKSPLLYHGPALLVVGFGLSVSIVSTVLQKITIIDGPDLAHMSGRKTPAIYQEPPTHHADSWESTDYFISFDLTIIERPKSNLVSGAQEVEQPPEPQE